MPIVIEEMTGEIVPPRGPEEERSDSSAQSLTEPEMRRRVRRSMARESRYSDRLCDR
mgnify:CR=1 FL=1